jgi:hypothetical protein
MDKMTIKFRSDILGLNDENLAKEKIEKYLQLIIK